MPSFLDLGSYAVHQNEDNKDSHDREEDRADCEPSLGLTESGVFGDTRSINVDCESDT